MQKEDELKKLIEAGVEKEFAYNLVYGMVLKDRKEETKKES